MSRKTVGVNKYTYAKLRAYAKDDSLNSALNRLLDESEVPIQYTEEDLRKTNISLDESTLDRLKIYKLKENESHSDTILRLLQLLE